MLYIIGLGLADEKDITVKGLEAVKSCARVYLEAYTSILLVDPARLAAYYEKEVVIADRDMVETEADKILADADKVNVAFLVVGDPYGATTHTDLYLRAKEKQIPVKTIHNASIMNAVGAAGLQLYHFGPTVSIPFFTETWRPDSFYAKIKQSRSQHWHTLCLLDIKVKEQSIENLARGRKIYEPPRYMTIHQCIEQLLEVEETYKEGYCSATTIGVGLARVGAESQKICAGTLKELLEVDFGAPLHCFILPGKMHFLEAEMLLQYAVNPVTLKQYAEIES